MKCWSVAAAAIIIALAPIAALMTSAKAAGLPSETTVNRGVVQLETARAAGISVRIAEDLASIIDDGATRRVLPVDPSVIVTLRILSSRSLPAFRRCLILAIIRSGVR